MKTTDYTKLSLCISSVLFFHLHVGFQDQTIKFKKNTLFIFCLWHTFNRFPSLTHGLSSFGKLLNPVSWKKLFTYSGYACSNSFKNYTFIIKWYWKGSFLSYKLNTVWSIVSSFYFKKLLKIHQKLFRSRVSLLDNFFLEASISLLFEVLRVVFAFLNLYRNTWRTNKGELEPGELQILAF